jgi:hypothetical protein
LVPARPSTTGRSLGSKRHSLSLKNHPLEEPSALTQLSYGRVGPFLRGRDSNLLELPNAAIFSCGPKLGSQSAH